MQQNIHPTIFDLVLIGGGHSHAIALKLFGMKPIPGVRLTLITDTPHTPYSGMLPGHVAGFYSYDETHIDLRRLAGFARAQLYIDKAIGLDLNNNKVICAHHPPVAFDYLSIDIGSTPATISVPGAREYAIPAKPVPLFLTAWNQIVETVSHNPEQPLTLSIVGGGAGGVELAINMQANLHRILKHADQPKDNLQIHLFHRATKLLPHHNQWVSNHLEQILLNRGIKLHLETNVTEIEATKIICDCGLTVACNRTFWVTQASAPSWIKASGLTTDERGFILVKDTLQSISHPHIFAAGDIATMQNYQRPKAGVFAVRQGKPLFENLQRILLGKPLKLYKPQKRYLSLIGTADRSAIASWSFLGWRSPILWRWKDYIDRKFMRLFEDFPQMNETKPPNTPPLNKGRVAMKGDTPKFDPSYFTPQSRPPLTPPYQGEDSNFLGGTQEEIQNQMYCAGCGSKVSSTTLERVLQRLEIRPNKDIVIGLNTPDDAAIIQVPLGQLMVQTIDYFTSLINDPFIFGKIAANHCLSDIFAMGATPQSALAVATIPYGYEDKVEETLYQLLQGCTQILQECETSLIGGHTTEGNELAFGLSCNGLVHPDKILRKSGMKPGQVLIMTKAIGTGTLFAADMRYFAKGRWIEGAVESMLLSNGAAAKILLEAGATACTDITGFGLLGHLIEMVKASQVGVELDLDAIAILPGAIETVQMGITSSLQPHNLKFSGYISNLAAVSNLTKYPLLFDPQTSGGLLAAIPAEKADECIKKLKAVGYKSSCIIGRVISAQKAMPIIVLSKKC